MSTEVKNLVEELNRQFEEFKTANDAGRDDLVRNIEAKMAETQDEIKEMKVALARATVEEGLEEAKEINTHEKAFEDFARHGIENAEFKAMNTGTGSAGGFLVPPTLEDGIVKLLRELTPMRGVSKSVRLTQAAVYNKNIQDGLAAAAWVAETGTRSNTATPTFQQITIAPHELYANPQVTQTMLEDDGFDLEMWLQDEVVREFATVENTAFTVGTGTGQPKGLSQYTGATGGVQVIGQVAAAANTIAGDDLIAAIYDIKPQYRANAKWMMNRNTLEAIRKLKASDGTYLFNRGSGLVEPGIVGYLLGYPVIENEDLPDIATTSEPIYFGDFSKGYTVVDRMGMSVLRNPFINPGFVEFYCRSRCGGGVEDGNALRVIKMAI